MISCDKSAARVSYHLCNNSSQSGNGGDGVGLTLRKEARIDRFRDVGIPSAPSMAGNLDLTETASRLVRQAVDSGEWRLVRDHSGRECYFNETTRETTRDLRILLLKRHDWAKAGGIGAASLAKSTTSADGGDPIDSHFSRSSCVRQPTAEQQLAAARAALLAYEREVTELRIRLFETPKAASAFASQLHQHSTNTKHRTAAAGSDVSSAATPSPPPTAATGTAPGASEAHVLQEQLAAARRLNAMLLERVTIDRQAKSLCSACLERVALPAVGVDHASLMAAETITFPESLRPFSTGSAVDRVATRALTGPDGYSAVAPPISLGYLPATWQPKPTSYGTLRPDFAESATSHAPLNGTGTSAGVTKPPPFNTPTPRRHALAETPSAGSTYYSPVPDPHGHRAATAAAAAGSRWGHAEQRRISAGVPQRLYDGGLHSTAL
jgi:hypothetical protein